MPYTCRASHICSRASITVQTAPSEGLATDEMERIELVRRFHRRARIVLPSERAHAAFHVVVEDQVAMGEETPVAATLDRLIREGLDRHEAVHAIASVLAGQLWEALESDKTAVGSFYDEVARLSARQWLESFRE
jgi:hypothetical protein